jgi:hypothetical protein
MQQASLADVQQCPAMRAKFLTYCIMHEGTGRRALDGRHARAAGGG